MASMSLVEQLEKGAWGVIRKTIGAVMRSALVGLVIGVVLGEVGGAVLDNSSGFKFPGGLFVQVASVAFGLVLAFAFAMTTALVEGVKGIVAAARDLEKEAQQTVGTGLRDAGAGAGKVVESVEHRQ